MKDIHEKWKGQAEKLTLAGKQLTETVEKISNKFNLEEANEESDNTLTIRRDLNNSLRCDLLFT